MTERERIHEGQTMKRERLEARLTPEQKALLQHAADLRGRTLSDFVLSSSLEAAEDVIRTHEVTTLTARDSRTFVEALLDPPPPTARQREAAARFMREFLEH